MKTLIIIGGFVWLAFFVFHLLFWKIFDWKRDLENLTSVNKAVMQVLNLSLSVVFLIFAYVSIFHAEELLTTSLGKSIVGGIVLFGFLRGVQQVVFFDLKNVRSKAILGIIICATTLYLIPLFV